MKRMITILAVFALVAALPVLAYAAQDTVNIQYNHGSYITIAVTPDTVIFPDDDIVAAPGNELMAAPQMGIDMTWAVGVGETASLKVSSNGMTGPEAIVPDYLRVQCGDVGWTFNEILSPAPALIAAVGGPNEDTQHLDVDIYLKAMDDGGMPPVYRPWMVGAYSGTVVFDFVIE